MPGHADRDAGDALTQRRAPLLYVDVAYQRLLAQCPGDIVAVNTRYSTKLGFLSYMNTVEMQAFCLR
jgi:hypothetical protein